MNVIISSVLANSRIMTSAGRLPKCSMLLLLMQLHSYLTDTGESRYVFHHVDHLNIKRRDDSYIAEMTNDGECYDHSLSYLWGEFDG